MTDEISDEQHRAQVAADALEIAIDLMLNRGLYSAIDASSEVGQEVETVLRRSHSIGFDTYCVSCRRETTFRISSADVPAQSIGGRFRQQIATPSLFAVHASCQRDWRVYSYVFLKKDGMLTKIGQQPSMADVAFGELRSFGDSLEKMDRAELGKALGLFAHDSSIGAFVYLRRVFERMVDRAHQRQSDAGNPVPDFAALPMDKKVATLTLELPERAVRNSAVFSVLSAGLHELTEEKCATYFPVMKAVLFQMLEQEEHKRKAAITAKETDAAFQRILSDLNGPGIPVTETE